MKDIERLSRLALTLTVIVIIISSGSWAQEEESSDSRSLVLDIYADDAGKALVTGYANGIEGLPFLNASEYQYDEDASQLYAVTNALTWKSGDEWEIRLPAEGIYGEYHVTFYLSENVQLSNITGTVGLDYLVSSSSDSFMVEFHGYDVTGPTAAVRYRQPLTGGHVEGAASGLPPEESSSAPIILVGAIVALIAIVAAAKLRKMGSSPLQGASKTSDGFEADEALLEVPEAEESHGAEAVSIPDASRPPSSEDEKADSSISAGMVAVMDTLTERERSVLKSLIKHDGKMTQADIRYETGIPKSSLTGIIISLERRNIVTKKEWGRTNVIELSQRLRGEDDRDWTICERGEDVY
ncbi:MAG: hypothetical protein WCY97_06975 [Methanothrix sp.]|jgi:uncharacterized membrane protein|uniref:Conserved hypothetical extracellular protein n=1 Tax=Methanothrix harundinacea TaxID=301375 RepID=A0A101IJW0_9EURY|nr:MAG: Conserved hypothetical extracellular protein [Methanothrix harundinacea]MDD3709664.1 hypothetical protein [Methanothrix sp.]MDI9400160.1 hypothetical protein [Euryarchaeota archaeon]KUK96616.1 MAG: Conserved hypothetical extracellular protein [Methanothrix harundinacea]MCP1392693.1 hypothetical protein [Methanothrix harundinacea]